MQPCGDRFDRQRRLPALPPRQRHLPRIAFAPPGQFFLAPTQARQLLGEGLEEIVAIHVVQENRLAPFAPANDVIDGTGEFDSDLAWHGNEATTNRGHSQ